MEKITQSIFNKINKQKKIPIDFVDFGSKVGGSMDFAKKVLGGIRGIGIDIRPRFVEEAQKAGYEVILGDATKLKIPSKIVRFAVMSHFLEHLPTLGDAEKSIENAVRISKEFVYIKGPVFDDEEYLRSLGLKAYWSDWKGHPCHFKTKDLIRILRKLGLTNYEINFYGSIIDSNNPSIHPISSSTDEHEYDVKIHPKKEYKKFNHDLKKEFECYIYLNRERKTGGHKIKKILYMIWNKVLR